MKVFGLKRVEPTWEDEAAAARLSAVAARFKPVLSDAAGGVEGPQADYRDEVAVNEVAEEPPEPTAE